MLKLKNSLLHPTYVTIPEKSLEMPCKIIKSALITIKELL